MQQELLILLSSSTKGVPSVAGTTFSSGLVYDRDHQCSRNYLFFCPRLRWGYLVQQELLILLSSSTTGVPSVAGTTYSSVLIYDGDPQCSRIYFLFCPHLRWGSLVQQDLLTLLSSSTTGVPSVAGTTYSSVLIYDGDPQCSRNYLLFCPHLRRGSLVQQELLTLLSSSTKGVPSVAGTTYSSVLIYDADPQCSRIYFLFCPHIRWGSLVQQDILTLLSSSTTGDPQCSRNYLLFCPHLRRGSLVQQELLTLLSSSTTGVPSVSGATYYSVLFYDRGPQSSRNYLLFCPHLRRGSLVYQELLTLLSSSTTGVPSVAGTIYSSVLVYQGGPQCSRNYLLFCPRLRKGSLVQQEPLTLLSSSTMVVPSVAGTTYSSVLVYDGIPSVAGTTYSSVLIYDGDLQCIRNYLFFCPRLRRGSQCIRNYLLFCPHLQRESLVQQELLTLLSSSTTGVPCVAGTTYSSVLIYEGGPQCSRNYLLFCPHLRRGSLVQQELLTLLSSSTKGIPCVAGTTYSSVLVYDRGPQCSMIYLLFCPRLRRGSLVQQERLTLLSSSTMGIPSVAGSTYSSVLLYDRGPQCSRNYLLFCPHLRRGSLVQQELLTLLSSSTTWVPSVAGSTYSSVLVYEGGPQCSRNYLLFCPHLRWGSLVQQDLLSLLSSSTMGIPSVAGSTYSSVLLYDRGPQCSRNYLLFCPHLRQGSLVQQDLLSLLSSSTMGILSVAGSTYSSVLLYDRGPWCSRNYLLFCPHLRQGIPSVAGTTYSSVLIYDGDPQCSRNYLLFCPRLRRGPQCSRNYLLFCPHLRWGSLVQQDLLSLLSSSTMGIPSVAGSTYSSVLLYDGDPYCSRNYLLFCPRLRQGSLVQQELLTLLSSSTTGVPSVAGTIYSSLLVNDGDPQCSRNSLLFCPRLRRGSLVQQDLLTLLSSSTTRVPSVAGTTYSSVLVYDRGPQCCRNDVLFCPRLRRGSLEQQELLTLLSSSTKGIPSVAGTTYSSVLVYDRGPQCSRNYLFFCPRL